MSSVGQISSGKPLVLWAARTLQPNLWRCKATPTRCYWNKNYKPLRDLVPQGNWAMYPNNQRAWFMSILDSKNKTNKRNKQKNSLRFSSFVLYSLISVPFEAFLECKPILPGFHFFALSHLYHAFLKMNSKFFVMASITWYCSWRLVNFRKNLILSSMMVVWLVGCFILEILRL